MPSPQERSELVSLERVLAGTNPLFKANFGSFSWSGSKMEHPRDERRRRLGVGGVGVPKTRGHDLLSTT
jgi:hypothetical protein